MPVLQADRIISVLRGAFAKDSTRQQILQIVADKMQAVGAPYTSVYLYMLHGDELVLETYAGRTTDHVRIKVGHGVCGTAVSENADQNVPDVQGRENYIACNLFTRSELVVLIRRGREVLGQIDVDSDVLDPFTDDEVAEVRKVAEAAAVLI